MLILGNFNRGNVLSPSYCDTESRLITESSQLHLQRRLGDVASAPFRGRAEMETDKEAPQLT